MATCLGLSTWLRYRWLARLPEREETRWRPRRRSLNPVLAERRLLAIVPTLARQKTPWQLYPTYEQIFTAFADREAALAVPNQPTDPHARLAQHLRRMAALLTAMGGQARLRDDIKRGRSSVAPEERQRTFMSAGAEHERLLAEFARLGAALPQTRVSPSTDNC